MTSFIIQAHEGRPLPQSWRVHPDCPFCRIIRGDAPAFRIYEDEKVIAILGTIVSELPAEFAAATGEAISKVSRAIAEALDNTALNVVCNQEYAQAVPHVHYHVIPAPRAASAPPVSAIVDCVMKPATEKEMHQREFESREELEDEEAQILMERIRARL
ncbi:Protein hit [Grifola frondosa]|uniref:Protein hit n=1 Tax=Grifola frondosa TaxID=5627 RepID=A0A1C7M5M4_GRIFR|nr:Protein hit [Grifola frondosa]